MAAKLSPTTRVCRLTAAALAHNLSSEAEVDALLDQAVAAGVILVKPAQKVFWGGYSGYFADPDGHLWGVAYNPFGWIGPSDDVT